MTLEQALDKIEELEREVHILILLLLPAIGLVVGSVVGNILGRIFIH